MADTTHVSMVESCAGFPFEKLPTELQLRVILYAMPLQGLLPQPLSDPTQYEIWYNGHNDRFIRYQK